MKKRFVIGVLLFLLVGCNSNPSTSSSNSIDDISTSENSTPSSTAPVDTKEVMQDFLTRILSLEGNVCSTKQTVIGIEYRLTESLPFIMSMKEISSTTRYVDSDNNPIVVDEGKNGFLGDNGEEPSEYTEYISQRSQDENYLYRITRYKDADLTDKIEKYARSETDVIFFNIGFPLSEYENILFMINNFDNSAINIEIKNFDQVIDNGIWEFEYEVTFYESASLKIPSQIQRYKNRLTIENGIITKLEQDRDVEEYLAGIKAHWIEYHTEKQYFQGEYQIFNGEKFN